VELALYFRIRRMRHAGWVLFDGIATLVLGLLIWAHWPSSSVWVICTLIGISGISRFMLGLAVRNPTPGPQLTNLTILPSRPSRAHRTTACPYRLVRHPIF